MHGIFHLDGYTEYLLDLNPVPRIVGKADYGGSGMIYAIEIDGRDSISELMVIPEPTGAA